MGLKRDNNDQYQSFFYSENQQPACLERPRVNFASNTTCIKMSPDSGSLAISPSPQSSDLYFMVYNGKKAGRRAFTDFHQCSREAYDSQRFAFEVKLSVDGNIVGRYLANCIGNELELFSSVDPNDLSHLIPGKETKIQQQHGDRCKSQDREDRYPTTVIGVRG